MIDFFMFLGGMFLSIVIIGLAIGVVICILNALTKNF